MNTATKRLAIALAISVAANLFVAGFAIARAVYHFPHHREGFHGPFLGPHGMMRDERGPLADAIRGAMQRHGDAFRAQRAHLRDAQRAVHAALTAEPYDAQALARALADLRTATAQSQQLMHDALLELAGTLAPEQRHELLRNAQALARGWSEPGGL
jgi:Spy/CpxP family protein refolding chaperone